MNRPFPPSTPPPPQVKVGTALCTIDGDEASVVRAKLEAAEAEEDAKAPPPEVIIGEGAALLW